MSLRVLVVDDNATILDALRLALELAGIESVVATTCREAAQFLDHAALDVALVDLGLPDGDGFQVLSQFKAARPGLPVLIHTCHDRPSFLARSHRLGAQGYVVKGLHHRPIVELIRSAADGQAVWTDSQRGTIARLQAADGTPPPS